MLAVASTVMSSRSSTAHTKTDTAAAVPITTMTESDAQKAAGAQASAEDPLFTKLVRNICTAPFKKIACILLLHCGKVNRYFDFLCSFFRKIHYPCHRPPADDRKPYLSLRTSAHTGVAISAQTYQICHCEPVTDVYFGGNLSRTDDCPRNGKAQKLIT